MNDYHKYQPVPTSKQELIDAVEFATKITEDIGIWLVGGQSTFSLLNQQLGKLRTLAEHLPEGKT